MPFYALHTFRHGFRPTLHYACLLCAYSRGVDLWADGKSKGTGGIDWRVRRIVSLDYFPISNDSRRLQMNQIRTWTRVCGESVEFFSLEFWRMESKGGNRFRIENFRPERKRTMGEYIFSPNCHNSSQFLSIFYFFITRFLETSNKSDLTLCASSRF